MSIGDKIKELRAKKRESLQQVADAPEDAASAEHAPAKITDAYAVR